MSVRERKWRTGKGEARSAWVCEYYDERGRHLKTFQRKQQAIRWGEAMSSRETKEYELSVPGAIAKIRDDLAWRGPNEKLARYVLLERAHAALILGVLDPKAREEFK